MSFSLHNSNDPSTGGTTNLMEDWDFTTGVADTQYLNSTLGDPLYTPDYHSDDDPLEDDNMAGTSHLDTLENKEAEEEEPTQPVFQVERMPHLRIGGSVRRLAAGDGELLLGTEDGRLVSISSDGEEGGEWRISNSNVSIHRVFLDPSGIHALCSLSNGDNYYLNLSGKRKPRRIEKMKGTRIESVGWDVQATTETVTSLLLGTAEGKLCEARFESESLKHFKTAFSLRDNANDDSPVVSITGLEVEYFPSRRDYDDMSEGTKKYFVMATTPYRFYQFIGGPTFSDMFREYFNEPLFQELPSQTPVHRSELHFFRKIQFLASNPLPEAFAWASVQGLFHGSLKFRDQTPHESVVGDTGLVLWDNDLLTSPELIGIEGELSEEERKEREDDAVVPVSIGVTEFHLLVLYPDRLRIIQQPPGLCDQRSSESKVVLEEQFASGIRARGLVTDGKNGNLWIYTDTDILSITVSEDENRDIWRLYLEQATDPRHPKPAHFITARRLVGTDTRKLDHVLTTEADFYFQRREYERAAKLYARTRKSFEEVVLSFLSLGQREALKTYLLERVALIRGPRDRPNEAATQLTCLCTWLTEIYLHMLNELRDRMPMESWRRQQQKWNKREFTSFDDENENDEESIGYMNEFEEDEYETEYLDLLDEFHQFLADSKLDLKRDPQTTFDLISSHGYTEEVLYFAELIEDYERVLSYHVTNRQYEEALRVLDKYCRHEEYKNLFQNFSPILMQHHPSRLVRIWRRCSFLDPADLVPAIMRHQPDPHKSHDEVISYLRSCVESQQLSGSAIHNLLISLYAQQDDDTELIDFLSSCKLLRNRGSSTMAGAGMDLDMGGGGEGTEAGYDAQHALRVCRDNNKTQALIVLYRKMQLYEDAVQLALSIGDVEQARQTAREAAGEEDGMMTNLLNSHTGFLDGIRSGLEGEKEDLVRRLWLRIAEHVIKTQHDTRQAVELLEESSLKLEDILPFFPEDVKIDEFKEQICTSLEGYNQEKERLKQEMDDATANANLIRGDIKELRNRYGYVSSTSKCDLCTQSILATEFYLFPCGHMFHIDCLITEVSRNVDAERRSRIQQLQQQYSRIRGHVHSGGPDNNNNNNNADIDIWRQLDEFVARECVYCGELMIKSINIPFVDPEKEKEEIESWSI